VMFFVVICLIVVVILIQNVFMKASEKSITLPGFERLTHLHEHFNTSTKNFRITIKTIKS
jgi:hypothetical protein